MYVPSLLVTISTLPGPVTFDAMRVRVEVGVTVKVRVGSIVSWRRVPEYLQILKKGFYHPPIHAGMVRQFRLILIFMSGYIRVSTITSPLVKHLKGSASLARPPPAPSRAKTPWSPPCRGTCGAGFPGEVSSTLTLEMQREGERGDV